MNDHFTLPTPRSERQDIDYVDIEAIGLPQLHRLGGATMAVTGLHLDGNH